MSLIPTNANRAERDSVRSAIADRVGRLEPCGPESGRRSDIRAACIMDAFSYACFKYECSLIHLHPGTWRRQIQLFKPDLLLVESAWLGLDGTWRRRLCGKGKASDGTIRKLVRFCKKNGIPTVFWNKEDSPNYRHFIASAKLFDYVFTTDANCIEQYKRDLGHDRIGVLPFAAQPALHNPVDSGLPGKENVAFAGTWYRTKYPHRIKDMSLILAPARGYNLHIFDRKNKYKVNDSYRFPPRYRPYIVGVLPYEQMAKAYRLYKVFLNVNSVTDSPTMFSRRVFEILASGTNVVSTYALGIEKMFPGIVPITRSARETCAHLQNLLHNAHESRKLGLLGLREVHQKHLYRHRLDQILRTLGLPESGHKRVAVVACQDQFANLERLLVSYRRQAWPHKQLILLLDEDCMPEKRLTELRAQPDISLHFFSPGAAFDERVGFAIRHTDCEYIAPMNGADHYAAHFLTDLMHAFDYADASVVGKRARYRYLESRNRLQLVSPEDENRYVDRLCADAMIVKKEVFFEIPLPGRSEQEAASFFSKCRENGRRLFAADPFNYIHLVQETGESPPSPAGPAIETVEEVDCGDDHLTYATV